MSYITSLKWDTDFFEKRIGIVLINDENNFNPKLFLEEANDNFDLVYVFSFQNELSFENVKSANLDLVDIMMTMSRPFDKQQYLSNEYDFKTNLNQSELEECYDISEQTSIVSRFYKEKMIGIDKTKLLYRKWIDNAFNNTFSDGLFVVRELNKIIGIHLIKIDKENRIGRFTLTGVHSDYKRGGLGRKLWEQSFAYFANETDIEIIKSPFSLKNVDSMNFHLKMGFNKVEEIKYIYHFRNEKGNSILK
jgi:N-acetylglutamate synthase-like GNAT family acetyltransferase